MAHNIYLDYAAATPMDETVLAVMQPYFSDKFYNPSATYLPAVAVKADLQAARAKVANILGTRPAEIIFTAGGTEANNLAINGVMRQYPRGNIVISAIEHDSVMEPASQYDCRIVRVKHSGEIDLDKLESAIDDSTVLVSIMYANNEIGTIQPMSEISRIIDLKRKSRSTNDNPLLFHTDACQAAAYLDLHVSRLGVDMMTLNGGKIYGPKQSGVLMIKAGLVMDPLILGGGQENNLRSGTENVAGCIGFATALELVQNRRTQEVERLSNLQKLFYELLEKQLPSATINGTLQRRLSNNLHITFSGQDNERLMMELDAVGILCALGSACSASSDEPSHVLKAIRLSDEEARSSIRFTMGISTTDKEIHILLKELNRLLTIAK